MSSQRTESIYDVIPVEIAAGVLGYDAGDDQLPPDADTLTFNRFLDGNDEAFRSLYDAFERPLYLYVVRFMGSRSDAEDVFQDVWSRMYRLRGEMKTVLKFSGLLFTVARHLSLNAIRDRKLLPNVGFEDVPESELAVRGQGIEASDMREMLQRALLQIPAPHREAFILREYFGYSYEEIGDITGTPAANAKTRAWRARERLRKMIAAWLELKNNNEA